MHPSIYQPEDDSHLLSKVLKIQLPKIKDFKSLSYLEIGIGSGIQLQTLNEIKIPKKQITGIDINKEAVKLCKTKGFHCIHSDLFSKVKGKYDVIIFNPPYLPLDVNEPKESQTATTGGKNGSEIINEFLNQSLKYLKKNGKIFLLTSSLTTRIQWAGYKKKLLAKKKIFFEELYVWELIK